MFTIEYDDDGWFRIVAPDGTAGTWTENHAIAVCDWRGQRYIATSDYQSIGATAEGPADTMVFKITAQPCTVRESVPA